MPLIDTNVNDTDSILLTDPSSSINKYFKMNNI